MDPANALNRIRTTGSLSISPELFEKIYLSPQNKVAGDLRKTFGPIDVALIPIGAYAPEWFMKDQHCNPEDAVRILLALEATQALGIHWGTFQLTDEARDAPPVALTAAVAAAGLPPERFVAAEPGGVYEFGR